MHSHPTRDFRQVIELLFEQLGAALVLYARQWCRFPDDAVQEAFIELSKQDECPREPAAWLFTTVKRRAMNLARNEGRRQRHHQAAAENREPWFEGTDESDETHELLQQSIKKLTPLEREIVVARIWGELSFQQIADLVQSSTSTVHRHYQAALLKLREHVDPAHQTSALKVNIESSRP